MWWGRVAKDNVKIKGTPALAKAPRREGKAESEEKNEGIKSGRAQRRGDAEESFSFVLFVQASCASCLAFQVPLFSAEGLRSGWHQACCNEANDFSRVHSCTPSPREARICVGDVTPTYGLFRLSPSFASWRLRESWFEFDRAGVGDATPTYEFASGM